MYISSNVSLQANHIGGVMVSIFASSAGSNQIINKIGIWCFPTKNAALRSKSKDWFVSESG